MSWRNIFIQLATTMMIILGLFVVVPAQASTRDNDLGNELIVLTYHDIVANNEQDAYATTRSSLVAHLDYLQTHDYQPVSLELVEKVYAGKDSFPAKAVLLSFDDGLKSYAEFVAPLLKIYGYPSVLSVVTSWVDGDKPPQEYVGQLLDWDTLRSLQQSPLISIVSHSHNLHHGVPSNPQGNEAAAGTTRIYSGQTQAYENESQFRQRIASDLQKTQERFRQELHHPSKAITWPYGRYDGVTMEEASRLGMKLQLTLDDGPTTGKTLPRLNRLMLSNHNVEQFAAELEYRRVMQHRDYFVELRLDPFVGQTAQQQEQLLSTLLDNLERLKVNAVLIHPFDQQSRRAFFLTTGVDVAADILNRVAHQIKTRLNVERIILSLTDIDNKLLTRTTMTDLARLVWFNGIVLHQQSPQQASEIKDIVRFYHPDIQFGQFVAPDHQQAGVLTGADFQLISVPVNIDERSLQQQLNASKNVTGRVLVSIEAANDKKNSITQIFNALEKAGIRDYGFNYRSALYSKSDKSTITQERAQDALAVFGG